MHDNSAKGLSGSPYGIHRVLDQEKTFPQSANRLDNDTSKLFDNEIRVSVHELCLDSASFRQIKESQANDPVRIASEIERTVANRGKMHNPVTGSGGVLMGVIDAIGRGLQTRISAKVGDRVVTLASLALTPLNLLGIRNVNLANGHISVRGSAIIFETAPFAKIPDDMNEDLVLSVLDVCGAPMQTARLVKKGDLVFIMGSGKSGMLCAYASREDLSKSCKIVMLVYSAEEAAIARSLDIVDEIIIGDATNPIQVKDEFDRVTEGRQADLTLNCVNTQFSEMASILCTKTGGTIYFFNMNTNFSRAALGAEGISKDVTMMIGNGYSAGHADYALQLVRDNPKLQTFFGPL